MSLLIRGVLLSGGLVSQGRREECRKDVAGDVVLRGQAPDLQGWKRPR